MLKPEDFGFLLLKGQQNQYSHPESQYSALPIPVPSKCRQVPGSTNSPVIMAQAGISPEPFSFSDGKSPGVGTKGTD